MNSVSNTDDIIDSRDVIKRIEELESEVEDLEEAANFCALKAKQDNAELYDELESLKVLAEEGENSSSDWSYGATLIRDSYFETYAQELADDTGAIDANATWPCNCIDWEQAAKELQSDYTPIDFDGETYWVRP